MKAVYLILIAFMPLHSFGQSLFGTTGGTLSDSQNQFDFSIGESILADVSGSGFTYTVGFQQPYYDFFTLLPFSLFAQSGIPGPQVLDSRTNQRNTFMTKNFVKITIG